MENYQSHLIAALGQAVPDDAPLARALLGIGARVGHEEVAAAATAG